MGLCNKPSWSTADTVPPTAPNPDPQNFTIVDFREVGTALYLELRYHGCTNYEGLKVLVYKNATLDKVRNQVGGIDPHFCGRKGYLSPFARFEPTPEGRREAKTLAAVLGARKPPSAAEKRRLRVMDKLWPGVFPEADE